MAEQEACAHAVAEALDAADESGDARERARGESLLLPLLQGLLSGGDRLLAGLGAAGADVVADVRRSLARLRAALAPPTAHPNAAALLALADRLDSALDAADRLDGCKRRPKRRSRANRHTVGVTHEELEEARRMVDHEQLDEIARAEPESAVDDGPKRPPLMRSVGRESLPTVVTRERAPISQQHAEYRHSIGDGIPKCHPIAPPERATLMRNGAPHRVMRERPGNGIAAIANKFNSQVSGDAAPPKRAPQKMTAPKIRRPPSPTREDFKRAPLYRPLPPTYNFAAPPPPPSREETPRSINRFTNKRNRMKRANTIDIPKPLGAYESDGDTEDARPAVPTFQPQTENDHKFIAFMKKNEESNTTWNRVTGPSNWNDRFGNIKNAFENHGESRSRSSSDSSAKKFWQSAEDDAYRPPVRDHGPRPSRKTLNELQNMRIDREAPRPAERTKSPFLSRTPDFPPASPAKSVMLKPFAAKPIPVNQFSHAPMSAFKPLKKISSPMTAPPNIWSPPSAKTASPRPFENGLPASPETTSPAGAPWIGNEFDKPKRVLGLAASKFENKRYAPPVPPMSSVRPPAPPAPPSCKERKFGPFGDATEPTHPRPDHAVSSIPGRNDLTAPGLVKRMHTKPAYDNDDGYSPSRVDAQQLQIEFYEKQIRNKKHNGTMSNGHHHEHERNRFDDKNKPPPPPDYIVTDYTPPNYIVTDYTPPNVVSTFVPLQQTPDIEKAKAHRVDCLPDVVMNENIDRPCARSPYATENKSYAGHRNGDATRSAVSESVRAGPESPEPTEYQTVTRVMRGPVQQQATITTGVRTRHEERRPRDSRAANDLKGALRKLSAPRREPLKKQVPNAHTTHENPSVPLIKHPPAPSPRAYRSGESLYSEESDESRDSKPTSPYASLPPSPGALSRSESWHQVNRRQESAPSPRRVVSRTKSMHLLSVPKMFEGGIARNEVGQKTRTVEAYFSSSGANVGRRGSVQSGRAGRVPGLVRSRTVGAMPELQLLDESDADLAFEDLVSALA